MWNLDSIRADMETRIPADPEEQRKLLLDLMVAAYPFYHVFSTIDCPKTRGTWFTSKLFPATWEEGADALHVYDEETRTFEKKSQKDAGWLSFAYETEESIRVGNRPDSTLPDDFSLMSGFLEVAGGQAFLGDIFALDARRLSAIYKRDKETSVD